MLTKAEALELFKELDWLVSEYTYGRTTARSIPHAIDKYTEPEYWTQAEIDKAKAEAAALLEVLS